VLATLKSWLPQVQAVGWTVVVALVASGLTIAVGMALVVRLPADYFVRDREPRGFWHLHPALRWTLLIAKNALGWLVILFGLLLSLPLVPGPGFLFILVGLGLVDFPGKRSLERRLIGLPRVLASLNRLRARFGRPPIQVGEDRDHRRGA